MVAIQAAFVAINLSMPFLTGSFLSYTYLDFLMAYLTAIIELILVVGFLRGSKWAWFAGLFYSGLSVLMYAVSYLSVPSVFYIILIFMRIVVMASLRSRNVRAYFDITRFTR